MEMMRAKKLLKAAKMTLLLVQMIPLVTKRILMPKVEKTLKVTWKSLLVTSHLMAKIQLMTMSSQLMMLRMMT